MKAGHGLNSTRLTAGAFANAFGSDALLRRSGHRHAGAGGGSLGRKRRVPALPFEGAPLLHLDPPYLEVPVVPQAVFTQGLARSSRIRRSVLTVADCHPDGGQRRTAGRLVQAAPVAGGHSNHRAVHVAQPLVSGKVLCGGQQTLSIQCRGGNLSGKRFELLAAENWAGAPLPRFSTMRDAHRPVRFLRVDRPSPSPGVSEMRGPLRRSSSAEEAFLLGSVLGDGLRATDLPREPAGHRSLPPIRDRETLSPGVS